MQKKKRKEKRLSAIFLVGNRRQHSQIFRSIPMFSMPIYRLRLCIELGFNNELLILFRPTTFYSQHWHIKQYNGKAKRHEQQRRRRSDVISPAIEPNRRPIPFSNSAALFKSRGRSADTGSLPRIEQYLFWRPRTQPKWIGRPANDRGNRRRKQNAIDVKLCDTFKSSLTKLYIYWNNNMWQWIASNNHSYYITSTSIIKNNI